MWTPDSSQIITADIRKAGAEQALWDALRTERNRRLAVTDPKVLRHADEMALEMTTTLDAKQYTDMLAYRQALRDLPSNTKDPANPLWPTMA